MFEKNVQYLKGVGPHKAKLLSRLGINTIGDLLSYYPKEYDDRRNTTKISLVTPGQRVTVSGKVLASDVLKLSRSLSVLKVALSDGTGTAFAMFFRKANPYHAHDVFSALRAKIKTGSTVIANGTASLNFGERQVNVEEFEVMEENSPGDNLTGFKRIVPVYALTAGITNKWLRSLMRPALEAYAGCFEELLPEHEFKLLNLNPIREALNKIHFPGDPDEAEASRKRLAFDEFLLLETALTVTRRKNSAKIKNRRYSVGRQLLTPFRAKLGFEFTHAQKKTINEIFTDMESAKPMNRLLMGDVGSGKTVVALSAVLLAIENGFQAVFLAPTEILAEQHFITIGHLLEGLPVRSAILTGRHSAIKKKKDVILEGTAGGGIDLLVATHAALEGRVRFKNLSLAVIDEQHRFGVLQRGQIQQKSENPDILLMTATPIPRTLSLTLYGDMDISVIDELPPGRQRIETLHLSEPEGYGLVKEEISKGRQAYIVYPLVEESDKVELKAAVQEAGTLSSTVFSGFKVGLIHGQMKADAKDSIMRDFRNGKYDILFATTVIEVGIDVPNAAVMVIEHADRFGLSTLHQLRGRVGRGMNRSYCVLLGSPKTEEAKRRIEIMLNNSSGFDVAEADLDLRGPGEFFGTAQHGLLDLKAGNIIRDAGLIEQAKSTAAGIVDKDPELKTREYSKLRTELIRKYSGRLDLLMVG